MSYELLLSDEALAYLESNPKLYATIYNEVRSLLLKQFPYSIFYTISDSKKEVYIFAVIHTSRNPEIWQFRADLL